MARNDLVLALVKSGVAGDRDGARRVAEAIVADERSKQRGALAERLETALSSTPRVAAAPPREEVVGLQPRLPRRTLDTVCLTELNRILIDEFVEEQARSELLRSHGLEPRHTMLLVGPPGTGKTSLAEAAATALGLSLQVVRYDTLVGSYLGETSSRLKRVFDHARTHPCVLFFDEFDAIGKERGDPTDVGELKRVVASLLTQIDEMPSTTIVICATNHPELLDHAAWRRFEVRLTLALPDQEGLAAYFARFAATLDEPLGIALGTLAERMAGASYADAEALCLDAKRRSVLSLGARPIAGIVQELLDRRTAQAPPASSARPVVAHGAGVRTRVRQKRPPPSDRSFATELAIVAVSETNAKPKRTRTPHKKGKRKRRNARPTSSSSSAS